jgi:hypothetical protein
MARTTTTTAKRRRKFTKKGTQTPGDEAPPIPAKLRRLIANPEKGKLRWWFDVGHLVLLLHPRPEPGTKRHYGQKTTLKLAQRFRPNDATKAKSMSDMLVQARKLALCFDDWKTLERFQGALSIWHVMSLLAVEEAKGSKSTMDEMHQRCVADEWSVERLKHEIQNDKGVKRKSGRQPKPLGPATAGIAATDLIIAARRWTTYHKEWLTGRKSALKRTRRGGYTPSVLRDVEEAIQGLEEVRGAVKDELAELRLLAKKVASALKR